jgi:hypothetical protein
VREVVGHLADTERVFAYRALRIARGDATPLPRLRRERLRGAGRRRAPPLAELLDEFRAVRRATVALLAGLDDAALARRGTASGQPLTPRAAAYVIAGHERHHAAILRERYAGG